MPSPGITKAEGFPFCIAQTTRKIFLFTVHQIHLLHQIKQHTVKVYDSAGTAAHVFYMEVSGDLHAPFVLSLR